MKADPIVIFDFGNVIIDLNYERLFDQMKRTIGEDWNMDNIPTSIKEVMRKLEVGQINDEGFIWAFQQYNGNVNPKKIVDAWNSLLEGIPPIRMDFVKGMHERFRFALLSNINAIHEKYIHKYLLESFDITDFESTYFESVFYSHHLELRKPDEAIYKYVTNALEVDPGQILFIDDLEENIQAANKHGWHGVHHDPNLSIENVFEVYLDAYYQS